ncbi:adenosine 3'-phospho 5'-phosphosulfate transporter 2-like [Lineus longissimus]|uniref:adenosine 3'-phospho 5'-phosphosulfate transporter 2-like n=1 Tax=Lineus longissimus TaxID=88925 RepID=UPI002B4E5974
MNNSQERGKNLMLSSQYVHQYGARSILKMPQEQVKGKDTFKVEMPLLEAEKPSDLIILGVDIAKFPRTFQFFICTIGIFFFYLIYGYFQELIFRLEGFKPFGWYLTLVQFACYSGFGLVELQFKADKRRRIPIKTYGLIAFLTVATMGLSNTSVGYLNYPTQVIFKCCKLIPVLIGGILIQGKKFGVIDVSACVCMSIGLILFTLADSTVQPNFDSYGVLLISLALCADAAIGNFQEKAMKQHSSSNSEMVLYSYSVGFVYILVGMILSGQLIPAFTFCWSYPMKTYGYAVIFSLTGYLGLNFVLTMVKTSGALIAVTVTTCRKAVTIILSFLFFTKPFTMQYVWSGLVVVLGIYLNIYSKNKTNIDNSIISFKHYVTDRFLEVKHPIRAMDMSEANVV